MIYSEKNRKRKKAAAGLNTPASKALAPRTPGFAPASSNFSFFGYHDNFRINLVAS
jgi:hypothetical protein